MDLDNYKMFLFIFYYVILSLIALKPRYVKLS